MIPRPPRGGSFYARVVGEEVVWVPRTDAGGLSRARVRYLDVGADSGQDTGNPPRQVTSSSGEPTGKPPSESDAGTLQSGNPLSARSPENGGQDA